MNEKSSIVPIANRCGWTSTIPNPITCKFIDFIKTRNELTVIDIGAGLGVASIPAMEAGAIVIVNDIEQQHLNHIAELARTKGLEKRCLLMNASLPNLPDVSPLDAVHASNVLHFLTGNEIVQAAQWTHRTLKTGGKAFLQMQSPYCGQLHAFLPEYQSRKLAGIKWPGEITDSLHYATSEISHMMADFNHVLEAEIVTEVLREVGFSIEYADYYTRPGLPEVCRFDGRENLGIVAVKI